MPACTMKKVIIFTDGSCLGNPGPGGWAAILILPGTLHRKELSGGYLRTTNNRMEILAVIKALRALKEECEVDLYTDSRYVRDAVEKGWLASWQRQNWKKANKKPVINTDLWQMLVPLLDRHFLHFHWVRGHDGNQENERCDFLARTCAQSDNLQVDEGYTGIE